MKLEDVRQQCGVAALYMITSFMACLLVVNPNFVNSSSGLLSLIDGEGKNPFIRRVLGPMSIKLTASVVPKSIKTYINRIGNKLISSKDRVSGNNSKLSNKLHRLENNWHFVGIALAFKRCGFLPFPSVSESGIGRVLCFKKMAELVSASTHATIDSHVLSLSE